MSDTDFYPTGTLARPDEIRRSAGQLRAISGVLLGHGDNVGAVLSQVALSFSDVISSAVAAQIGANAAALETAVEGTEYGYAVGSAWADDVDAFIAARAELIARWEAAEATDFGVPPPSGLTNMEPEMAEQSYLNRRLDISAGRACALADFTAEGMLLWERFQDQVHEKGRLFRDGPTAANLALLGSYLGWSAMTLWPEMGTTPVAGGGDGTAAARDVLAGLDGRASPEAVVNALSALAMITSRAAYGHELTEAEMAYLEAFYATMGHRVLDVPNYLASASGMTYATEDPPEYVPSVPFVGTPQLVDSLTMAAANGLLILSRPTARTNDDDHDGYERLPQWARDAFNPTALTDQEVFNDLIGMGKLLAHSTMEAGSGLSRELAVSVDWMIEFAEGQEHPAYPHVAEDLRAQIAASAPSLLNVVSRNNEVCMDLLAGSDMLEGFSPAEYFTSIYAFDWAFEDGAAAASLTDFIPEWATMDDAVARSRAETALFDLVQIVTGDASFQQLMDGVGTSGVAAESAIGQVNPAITQGFVAAMASCMDQFAGPQIDVERPTELGDLSFETRVRFATLIGTDPDSAAAMAGAAYAYEQQQLYEYALSGDASVHGGYVGRIRGIVDDGLINAELDAGADAAAAEASAERARQLGIRIAKEVLGTIPVPGASTLVGIVAEIVNYELRESVGGPAGDPSDSSQTPGRTEDERRFDTAAGVMTGLVSSGQVPVSSIPPAMVRPDGTITMPPPFVGPAPADFEVPTADELTDVLLAAAEASGYDLATILDRIESAYSDPDLVDERDG